MAKELIIQEDAPKAAQYKILISQIDSLVTNEPDLIANLANIVSALKYEMNFFWVGFYLVKQEELVLGPFQGPVACTRIARGKGVCGTAWVRAEPVVVPNVDAFPGHIACNSATQSEIVLPGFKNGVVAWVLDIDADQPDAFDEVDQKYLQLLMKRVEQLF